jgi:hypothetical protein
MLGEGEQRRHRSGPMLYDGGYVCSCAYQPLVSTRKNKLCNAIMCLLDYQGGVLSDMVMYTNQVATQQCSYAERVLL